MKKILFLLLFILSTMTFAQNGFNYKALITDNGNAMATQTVNLKFTVLENGTTSVYQETQSATTDANGIVAVNIGEGTIVSGNFTTIDWGNSAYFLKVEIDTGSGYQDFGTSELKYVPYAIFAEKAGNVFSGDFNALTNVPSGLSDGDDDTHLTEAQVDAYVANNGYLTQVDNIRGIPVSATTPNNGQVLKYNGTQFVPADDDTSGGSGTDGVVNSAAFSGTTTKTLTLGRSNGLGNLTATFTDAVNDADHSSTNELQTISKTGNTITLSNGGGSVTDSDTHLTDSQIASMGYIKNANDADHDATNEIQTISKTGNTITLSNGGGSVTDADTHLTDSQIASMGYIKNANDADHDATNEIQHISKSGNTVTLSNGGGSFTDAVNDADHSTTNELQTISKTGNIITLSNGGGSFTDAVNDADHDATNELQALTLTGAQLSISNGNNVNFYGWDTDTSDDFDGDFTSLTNVPAGLSDGDDDTHLTDSQIAAMGYIKNPDDADNDPTNEIELPATATNGQVLTWNGTEWVAQNASIDNWGTQVVQTDSSLSGDGTSANPLSIDTSSSVFNGWDKDASDDFSGDYDDLSNKPALWGVLGGGSGAVPTNRHENIYRDGAMRIGTYNPTTNAKLDISIIGNSTDDEDTHAVRIAQANGSNEVLHALETNISGNGDGNHTSIYNQLTGTGNGYHTVVKNIIHSTGNGEHGGIYNGLMGAGNGTQYGVNNYINESGSGEHYGVKNSITSGTGNKYGMYNFLSGSDAVSYGAYNHIMNSNNGNNIGLYNFFTANGAGNSYGTKNQIQGNGDGLIFGNYSNIVTGGSGKHFGTFNAMGGNGTGDIYAVRDSIYAGGSGNVYGVSNYFDGSGSGTIIAMENVIHGANDVTINGNKILIDNSGDGYQYGSNIMLQGNGNGNQMGSSNYVSGSGNGLHTGTYNSLSNGDGTHYGVFNRLYGAGNGTHYGVYNKLEGTGTGDQLGVFTSISNDSADKQAGTVNIISSAGTGMHVGTYNGLHGSGTGDQYAIMDTIDSSGSGNHFGYYNYISGSGSGQQLGIYNLIDNSGNGIKRGVFNSITSDADGTQVGSQSNLNNDSNATRYGFKSRLTGNGTGMNVGYDAWISGSSNTAQYAVVDSISNSGSGNHYGAYNYLNGSGGGRHVGTMNKLDGTGGGYQFAIVDTISNSGNGIHIGFYGYLNGSGTGVHYGAYATLTGSGSGSQFGNVAYISNSGDGAHYGAHNLLTGVGNGARYGTHNILQGSGNGSHYGSYNKISSGGTGTKYATYNYITGSGTGTKYGTYNNINVSYSGQQIAVYGKVRTGTDNYAGLFEGDVKVTKKLVAPDSGIADMKAYIYGELRANGAIETDASSSGFTIMHTPTGIYTITFSNSPGGADKYVVSANMIDAIGFIKILKYTDHFTVVIYDPSGNPADEKFNFIVYKK